MNVLVADTGAHEPVVDSTTVNEQKERQVDVDRILATAEHYFEVGAKTVEIGGLCAPNVQILRARLNLMKADEVRKIANCLKR